MLEWFEKTLHFVYIIKRSKIVKFVFFHILRFKKSSLNLSINLNVTFQIFKTIEYYIIPTFHHQKQNNDECKHFQYVINIILHKTYSLVQGQHLFKSFKF